MRYIFGDSSHVDAHQHPNGGGWVADTAHVDNAAFVGPNAQVSGNARVCVGREFMILLKYTIMQQFMSMHE